MSNTYQIYLISDSTGETLDRIFLALKAQFSKIDYKIHSYSFWFIIGTVGFLAYAIFGGGM